MNIYYPGLRLRSLRIAAGFKRAKDFTETVGLVYQTYSAHERHPQTREIRADVAEEYAAIFRGEKKLKKTLPDNCRLDIEDVTGEWLRYGQTPNAPTPQILKNLSTDKIVSFPGAAEIDSDDKTTFERDVLKQIIERLFEISPRLDFPAENFFELLEFYHDRIMDAKQSPSDETTVIELDLISKIE